MTHTSSIQVRGWVGVALRLGDVISVAIETMEWTQLKTSGTPPSPRYVRSRDMIG